MAKLKDALATLLGIAFGLGMLALGVWIYVGNTIAKETGLPISRSEVFNMLSPLPDTDYQVTYQPNPVLRHQELKKHMLLLTNQERQKAGVPPVTLGENAAAQLHAEAALKGCYSSHWDRWGLKPNHRYTLTGGTGADSENVSGADYCIKPYENYETVSSMEDEVAEAVAGWMDSPGHRKTLLDPAHTLLNIGIAHDLHNTVMVQHFTSDYVRYETPPYIDQSGVLRLEATTSRASLEIGRKASVQIYYDPPPQPLTRSQLSRTYALCGGRQVAYVAKPLTGGSFYTDPAVQTKMQVHRCIDPYRIDPILPAPGSAAEANQAWTRAKAESANAPPIQVQLTRITGTRMEKSDHRILLEADLSPILQEQGPGIYSMVLWGRPNHMTESVPVSEQSIFWQTPFPPDSPYVHYRRDGSTHLAEAPTPAKLPGIPTTQPQSEGNTSATPPPNLAEPATETETSSPATRERAPDQTARPNKSAPSEPAVKPELTDHKIPPVADTKTPIPLNTPLPTPAGTEVPTPTPIPTAAPRPTPVPSPTATPPPTRETYTSREYGYSIDYPYGWTLITEGSRTLIQGQAVSAGFIEIHRYPVQRDQSIGDLADSYMKNVLLQASQWAQFNPSWASSAFNDSGQYLILKFTRRKSPTDCSESGEAHIFRSKYAPKQLQGYSLTMAVCRNNGTKLSEKMEVFLNTFREY